MKPACFVKTIAGVVTFVILVLNFAFIGWCGTENLVQDYADRLASKKIEVQILVAKELVTSGLSDPILFDEIERQLLLKYNRSGLNMYEIDLMSWFCKDLSSSGLSKYSTTLKNVAESYDYVKLSSYAEQSLVLLQTYAERNRKLSQKQNSESSEMGEQDAKIMIMLKYEKIKFRIDAAKMVTKSMCVDNKIYDEIECQSLRKNYYMV